MTYAEARDALRALEAGIPTWLNGVPVRRLPCAGAWFDVGSCVEHPDIRYQRLRLADAALRIRSGDFPTLGEPPRHLRPHRRCAECHEHRPDPHDGAFTWCTPCAAFVCRDCHNTHHERHETEPGRVTEQRGRRTR